jgi:bifunctional non-homologous end joining protein LigD
MPEKVAPMLATLVTNPVEETGWVYEMKWDGYRAVSYINSGSQFFRKHKRVGMITALKYF